MRERREDSPLVRGLESHTGLVRKRKKGNFSFSTIQLKKINGT